MQLLLFLITLCQFSLDPQPVWDLAQPDNQKGGDPVSDSSPVVPSNTPTNAPVDAGAAGEVFHTIRIQQWGATWCPSCPGGKAQAQAAADKLGVKLEYFDYDKHKALAQQLGVSSVPRTFVVIDDMIAHRYVGQTSSATIVAKARELAGTASLESRIEPVRERAQPVRMRQRLPVVNTKWGTIDLETYQRNCNCPMCQGIRQLQWQYRNSGPLIEQSSLPPGQQPTPDLILQDVVDELKLTRDDVLADFGCGDGRVLIAAVKQYGCKAVGVEIDAEMAAVARENVKAAGMENSITIITGDALDFEPEQHGITAAVAYLYPELLEKLQPKLKRIPVVVTPFHQVPGMEMTRRGELWVRKVRA